MLSQILAIVDCNPAILYSAVKIVHLGIVMDNLKYLHFIGKLIPS